MCLIVCWVFCVSHIRSVCVLCGVLIQSVPNRSLMRFYFSCPSRQYTAGRSQTAHFKLKLFSMCINHVLSKNNYICRNPEENDSSWVLLSYFSPESFMWVSRQHVFVGWYFIHNYLWQRRDPSFSLMWHTTNSLSYKETAGKRSIDWSHEMLWVISRYLHIWRLIGIRSALWLPCSEQLWDHRSHQNKFLERTSV